MKRVLIVEDNFEHLRDAKEEGKRRGHEIFGATDCTWALKGLESGKFDGVITDVHIPVDAYRPEVEPIVLGGLVALRAQASGIPVVFCTDAYHHADDVEWLFLFGKNQMGWKMVDKLGADGKKKWKEAFAALEKQMQ